LGRRMSKQVTDTHKAVAQDLLDELAEIVGSDELAKKWYVGLQKLLASGWQVSRPLESPPDSAASDLLIALDDSGVIPGGLDVRGVMELIEELRKMEHKGWRFIPPPKPEEAN